MTNGIRAIWSNWRMARVGQTQAMRRLALQEGTDTCSCRPSLMSVTTALWQDHRGRPAEGVVVAADEDRFEDLAV